MYADKYYCSPPRRMTESEIAIVRALVQRARPETWEVLCIGLEERLVRTLNDGGMGSFGFCGLGRFGEVAIEVGAKDVDGKGLLIGLNLDETGQLFEIDVQNPEAPLVRWPSVEDLDWDPYKRAPT